MNIDELIECHELISDFEKALKAEPNLIKQNKLKVALANLKLNWFKLAKCDYPMVLNDNNKKVSIKTIIKELKTKEKNKLKNQSKPIFVSPGLDDIIKRTTNDTNLVSSLYDKNVVSDQPDPYRKRRKP